MVSGSASFRHFSKRKKLMGQVAAAQPDSGSDGFG